MLGYFFRLELFAVVILSRIPDHFSGAAVGGSDPRQDVPVAGSACEGNANALTNQASDLDAIGGLSEIWADRDDLLVMSTTPP